MISENVNPKTMLLISQIPSNFIKKVLVLIKI